MCAVRTEHNCQLRPVAGKLARGLNSPLLRQLHSDPLELDQPLSRPLHLGLILVGPLASNPLRNADVPERGRVGDEVNELFRSDWRPGLMGAWHSVQNVRHRRLDKQVEMCEAPEVQEYAQVREGARVEGEVSDIVEVCDKVVEAASVGEWVPVAPTNAGDVCELERLKRLGQCRELFECSPVDNLIECARGADGERAQRR